MRAVEDHHVDRLGVEAQQCVKLTSTNSSIGLIVLIYQCPPPKRVIPKGSQRPDQSAKGERPSFAW
jgi:hypothetical protein